MERINLKVEKLNIHVFDTRLEMGQIAAREAMLKINRFIAEKGEATVIFAAAPSQNEMLAALNEAAIDWTKVRALHMDEYIGLPADHPAGFGNFLRRAIFDHHPFKEIHYLYDNTVKPEEVCIRYADLIEQYPPDLVLLGVGENGHLAFNDPAVADFNDPLSVKIVELDNVCRTQQVNDGCFASFDDVPERAITITMSAIMHVRETICVVPDRLKAQAINAMLNGEITTDCPASILRKHDNSVLYLDMDSASLALI
jgi:glucosamine-6-phosphate deaminase